jgi:hypothetical protein
MNMAKHTRAPWHKTTFDNRGWLILHNNLPLAHVKHVNEDETIDNANANLIAEAPIMFGLLTEEVEYLDHWMNKLQLSAVDRAQMQERKEFILMTLNKITECQQN